MLDALFGRQIYRIDEAGQAACAVKTNELEVEFAYDPRDRWVSSMIKPLNVPEDLLGSSYPPGVFLPFLNIDEPVRKKSDLNTDQVVAELKLIEPLVRLFRNPQKARDLMWFARGYCSAYTDWARGRFG